MHKSGKEFSGGKLEITAEISDYNGRTVVIKEQKTMAERRMFAKTIIDSDAFLDMPLSAQALYFHLSMRADDDGFINNPKKIQKMAGASDDDCKLLIMKQFIIVFESGVIVIKHWKIHNYIRNDRKKETNYTAEMALLTEKENGAYSLKSEIPLLETEDTGETKRQKAAKKPVLHKYGEYKNVLLSDKDIEKLQAEFPTDYQERIERLSGYIASTGKSYKNHLATIRNWARKENPAKGQPSGSKQFQQFDAIARWVTEEDEKERNNGK